jgi:hypothetical protein
VFEGAARVIPVVARVDERQPPAKAVPRRGRDDGVEDADDGQALADLVLKDVFGQRVSVPPEVSDAWEVGPRRSLEVVRSDCRCEGFCQPASPQIGSDS